MNKKIINLYIIKMNSKILKYLISIVWETNKMNDLERDHDEYRNLIFSHVHTICNKIKYDSIFKEILTMYVLKICINFTIMWEYNIIKQLELMNRVWWITSLMFKNNLTLETINDENFKTIILLP